jgi:hypothetical protein
MKEGDRLRFNLAMSVVKLESAIKKAGYDLSGFNEAIKTFENKSLEKGRIITESARREDYELIRYPYAALNQEAERQRRAKPKLAKFHVEGGCGAGEVPVFFRSFPKFALSEIDPSWIPCTLRARYQKRDGPAQAEFDRLQLGADRLQKSKLPVRTLCHLVVLGRWLVQRQHTRYRLFRHPKGCTGPTALSP